MPRAKKQKTENDDATMSSNTHAWADLPSQLSSSIEKVNQIAEQDRQLRGFTFTDAITEPATWGLKSHGSEDVILCTITKGKVELRTGSQKDALFTLVALPEQWAEFFKQTPVMPYQSYWGMFGMNIKQEGISIEGDQLAFAQWTQIWRRVLELLHDQLVGETPADTEPERDDDHIVGRYAYITAPIWGRCKCFYEQSGTGTQEILFLHTAGSDSRQYHGVMNDERMLKKCHMTAVDLPAHGRSFPYENYFPGHHTNTEDSYVGFIAATIKKLGLKNAIVCGASMAGQICLAVAVRNAEVGAYGTIPLQGSDYLNMERQWNDQSPYVNQSLFNPEWIYGMMSPTAPLVNRQLIWHMYAAQSYGIFHGDLDFYFGGWDGRDRMKTIDTKTCPVYMLTGEYDWSNTPEMSQKTADKINGGKHSAMKGLGHFPATENPRVFVDYVLEAIDHIQRVHQG